MVALTPEQTCLLESIDVDATAERAVRAVVREWGQVMSRDDMFQECRFGVVRSAQSYEPGGCSFEKWAFFAACHAILEGSLSERRHDRMAKYRNLIGRVRQAAFAHMGQEHRLFDAFRDTADFVAAQRNGYSNSTLVRMAATVSSGPFASGGEEEVLEREAAQRAISALKSLVEELQPEQRELLELHFRDGIPLVRIAAMRGQPYPALLAQYHALEKVLGARLSGRGIAELPPLPEEASGAVLGRQNAEVE